MKANKMISILIICISLCLDGCLGTPVRYYMKPDLTVSHIETIAVFPFDNISGNPDAGKKIVNLLLTELIRTQLFKLADTGEVEDALRSLRIRTTAEIDLSKLQAIKERLNVQAIIIGSVDEYELRQERYGMVPEIAVNAKILDVQTGEILWTANHIRNGTDHETIFGLGRISSISQLARIVVSEMVKSLIQELSATSKTKK